MINTLKELLGIKTYESITDYQINRFIKYLVDTHNRLYDNHMIASFDEKYGITNHSVCIVFKTREQSIAPFNKHVSSHDIDQYTSMRLSWVTVYDGTVYAYYNKTSVKKTVFGWKW